MCNVPVKVMHIHSKKEVHTWIIIDCCSLGAFYQYWFIKETEGWWYENTLEFEAISGLKVSKSIRKLVWIDVPMTYSKNDLPSRDEDLANQTKSRS